MKKSLYGAVCAIALLCGGMAVGITPTPAYAQADVSFDVFHDELARYGDWVYSDRWGEVWVPDASADFQPYGTNGYWADTEDYGWTWVSDYPWGDIPFHYGRWVDDPDDGWLWIPGYVWSPAWVVWRSNDRFTGWMPMPPDDRFMSGDLDIGAGRVSFSVDFSNPDDFYGYRRWYGPSFDDDRFAGTWIFVSTDHFADRDFRRYQAPRAEYRSYIRNTTNITNYTVVNNRIFNRSVDASAVERASGRPVQRVNAAQVLKRTQFVTRVDQGQRAQKRVRDSLPRGTGAAGSAPRPTPAMTSGLSDKVSERHGRPAAHLYTRQTIDKAPANGRTATPAAATQMPQRATPETKPEQAPARTPETRPQREDRSAPQGGDMRRTPQATPNAAPAERRPEPQARPEPQGRFQDRQDRAAVPPQGRPAQPTPEPTSRQAAPTPAPNAMPERGRPQEERGRPDRARPDRGQPPETAARPAERAPEAQRQPPRAAPPQQPAARPEPQRAPPQQTRPEQQRQGGPQARPNAPPKQEHKEGQKDERKDEHKGD